MKKFLIISFVFIFTFLPIYSKTLQANVSVNEIPESLLGSWRINAKLDKTNSYKTFKPQCVDSWTLSKSNDTLTLTNPLTGATSDVSIDTVEGNLIIFTRIDTSNKNKILTETVQIRHSENFFHGINTLKLNSYSYVDGHLMKTENATYFINGEKISGKSTLQK